MSPGLNELTHEKLEMHVFVCMGSINIVVVCSAELVFFITQDSYTNFTLTGNNKRD